MGEAAKLVDFCMTTMPGPKQPQMICGVPVLEMYNCLATSGLPRWTCTGYAGRMYISLNVSAEVSKKSAELRSVWNEKLAEVLAGTE
eukprot:NODE_8499_length_380_cov_202.360000.p4 GENE.NODE_8499_length_380_cov_202.360000~~NODE_8499_length_380_cov_202.360000.p4  ORF type:complete len:87 (-),score=25.84 NODE_8499_length_380_cov_202.360000:102-362(-)